MALMHMFLHTVLPAIDGGFLLDFEHVMLAGFAEVAHIDFLLR
jgi:hypothetical protein